MGKSTISMAIFNCYVSSPEGRSILVTGLFLVVKVKKILAEYLMISNDLIDFIP